MKTQSHVNRLVCMSLSASLLLGFSLDTKATSATWTGLGDGATWNETSTSNWSAAFPNSTADTATFSSAATITNLGQAITVGEIVQNTTGNVSITDGTNTLTLGTASSGTSIQGNTGQTLTLNLNTKFTNATAVMGGGGTINFGSAASPSGTTLNMNSKQLTLSGANSTVNLYSSISGGAALVNQSVTLNLGNSTGPSSIVLGKSGTNSSTASVSIITSGVTNSSNLSIAGGSGSSSQNSYTFGSNISGGGSSTFAGTLGITPGGTNANVTLSAAASNTLTFSNTISGGGAGVALRTQGGVVILSGANSYLAATQDNSGTLEFAKTTSMSATSTVTVASGATLAVAVGGTGQFTTTGTGTGTLAGVFTGTGGQTGSAISYAGGANVGIDTGSNSVSYGNAIINPGGSQIGVTKLGSGALTLTSASTYTGTTTVAAGTLVLGNGSGTVSTTTVNNTNGSATGLGPLVVSPGATLAGAGTAQVSSFNISGTSPASLAQVLVGQTSVSDINTTGALTLLGGATAGNSTIANANLTFNLDQSTVGAGNTLNVGATGIAFGASVTLTLNLQNTGVIPANSSYVLIAGTSSTTFSGGTSGTSSGQYGGLNVILNAQGLEQIVGSGNGLGGNLALALSGQSATWYGNGSYLYISQSGGVDDIDVEVVPEPGTWAMMLGGLAVLILWQRRKSKA